MLKAQLATLGFLLVLFLLTGIFFVLIAWHKYTIFQTSSGLSTSQLIEIVSSAWQKQTSANDDIIATLILGLDEVEARNQAVLTDTIILITLNPNTGIIQSLSLPRDLWIDQYKTKINALYYYGHKNSPTDPTEFVKTVVEDLSGISIDRVFPVSLEQLAELVDILGGLEISVEQAFTDEHFPRAGVNPSETSDLSVLQETITFDKGLQTMNGARILEYVRSRQAAGDVGTDDSRTQRQQAVITALLNKLQSKSVVTNPDTLGKLVAWYNRHYSKQWSPADLLSLGLTMARNQIRPKLLTHTLPIASDKGTDGVLYHPPTWRFQNQWVYIATDSAVLRTYIQSVLFASD